MDKSKLVKMAIAPRPHGIRGEVELVLLNPDTSETILKVGIRMYAFPSNEKSSVDPKGEEWMLERFNTGNKVIAFFRGIKDRTHLEKLLPFELYLPREEFPDTDEDEVYLVDLVAMDVFSPEEEKLGKLESFSDNGMQYLFNVRLENGELITLPFVETFFPKIDMEKQRIIMVLPEYTE
ncbi:MAG TPA: ribosome maturation factor RimM [Bacteriovoracaceae bacterium]|nr:ribosome maturation factor RimM [Bacteriovoracaceae bacterium]